MVEYREGDEYNPNEQKGLRSEINEIKEMIKSGGKKKYKMPYSKEFKVPITGKFGRAKLKNGWCIVQKIAENKVVTFTKARIDDGVIHLRSKGQEAETWHATEVEDILYYKGRRPLVIIPKNKINPYNPLKGDHETYGQEYIAAKMMKDTIKPKKGGGGFFMVIIALVVIGGVIWWIKNRGAS